MMVGAMFNPFEAWSRMASAGLDMQTTWLRGVETLRASNDVIGARTALIRAATVSPLSGDYTELSRMVPEKVEAFSRSAQVVARDLMAMHSAWAAQMQRISMMMFAGRMPNLSEVTSLANQGADYAVGAVIASTRLGKGAMAPVYRTATGNARRLRRR